MRDIPSGGKMPSVTVIDIKGKGGKTPGAPPPDAAAPPPPDDESAESHFKCPICGASLCATSKEEEDAEGSEGADLGMPRGRMGT
ncbi:MAG TPA: hypothetical protein VE958_08075 [Bryobacteraceae bacterium]|nr:hypothetical protein [Bryobacteraceae bacterium]